MIAVGGMKIEHALPPDGVDLRAELAEHQRSRIAQALLRADGDLALAAKLLRLSPLDLVRLHAGNAAVASAREQAAAQRAAAKQAATRAPAPEPCNVRPGEIPRIAGGIEVISRAAIKRLHAEGRTPRQIAARLGVNPFVIEKVLRAEAELAKCGPLAEPRPGSSSEPEGEGAA